MKRITHGFVVLLLGLAPAALASPNQPQSWNEQNAWNEENQQNEQTPQNQQQQQPEQQQQWGGQQGQTQGNWQEPPQQQQPQQAPQQQQQQEPRQPYYQDPSQNQPLPPPNQQMPPKPAWQQPVPNAGWQNQNQAWNQYQGYQQPMQNQGSMSTRPRLGIFVEGLTPELRSYFGAPNDRGLLVARVERHTAASRAGLQVGDVLMAIEGQPVNSANDVIGTLSRLSPTALIHLDIMRNGRQITLLTQLRPRPQLFRGQHT